MFIDYLFNLFKFSHVQGLYHFEAILQALVHDLRTIWRKINTFDISRIQQFLNPQLDYVITLSSGVEGNLIV